jgi:integrase
MDNNNVGRTRQVRNRDLERYVKRDARGYISYKHPLMDKPQTFGKDVGAANEVAKIVNARLSRQSEVVRRILEPAEATFSQVSQRFIAERVSDMKWSASYRRENLGRLKIMCAATGDQAFRDLDVLALNTLIDENFKGDGRRLARNMLMHLYRFAIGKGLHKSFNVAEQVLEISKAPRIRQRISNYADFEIIRAHAPVFTQNAMDISLITLQARQELCAMRLKDIEGDTLRVIRQKTARKTDRAYIEIQIGDELRKVLHRCRVEAMSYGSPYVLNYASRVKSMHKKHRTQVLPRMLSGAFTRAVNKCGLYDHLSPEQRPTLHEVRSLGGRLYESMGMPAEFIQTLYGHAGPGMTERYLEGDKIAWTKAVASMEFSQAAAATPNE